MIVPGSQEKSAISNSPVPRYFHFPMAFLLTAGNGWGISQANHDNYRTSDHEPADISSN
jgi:hypothetical protein